MKLSQNRKNETVAGYLFIAPWALGFVLLTLGPLIASFIISLWKWDLLSEPIFVGLRNYQFLFRDPDFWNALRVTAIYSFCRLPIMVALGLLLAILLNQKIKGLGFFRTIFYLPSVLPIVATAMLWMWIYNPQFGILN